MERTAAFAFGQRAVSAGPFTPGISLLTFKAMLLGNRQPGSNEPSPVKRRIMIVDDEKDISMIFKSGLERRSFEVEVFNDPVEALAKYQAGRYDILLLDVRMPVMNGFELYAQIKKKDPKARACFVSAFEVHVDEIRKHLPEQVEGCIVKKPVTVKELVEFINREIGAG